MSLALLKQFFREFDVPPALEPYAEFVAAAQHHWFTPDMAYPANARSIFGPDLGASFSQHEGTRVVGSICSRMPRRLRPTSHQGRPSCTTAPGTRRRRSSSDTVPGSRAAPVFKSPETALRA